MSKGPSMQLYQEGILQGITVDAIPGADRPKNLDGTMVGDIGFDPLGFSNWLNLNWAREAEIKHGRVAMLAATGMIVQDIAVIPGFDKEFSGAAMMKLHNLAVQQVCWQAVLRATRLLRAQQQRTPPALWPHGRASCRSRASHCFSVLVQGWGRLCAEGVG